MVPWMGAFLILFVSIFRRDQRRRWLDLSTVIGYAVYVALGTQLTIFLAQRMRRTYDSEFFRADAFVGFNAVAFANAVERHWVILVALMLSYIALPLLIGLAWVLEQDLVMRRAILLGGTLCFAFYGLFPAVGPGHYDWTRQAPLSAPDNCMPSMHLTWALLIAINARSLRLRLGLWIYVGLTIASTLALREHYLVDLIAAVPYTIAIQWLARRLSWSESTYSAGFSNASAAQLEGGQSES